MSKKVEKKIRTSSQRSTVNESEIRQFDALGAQWWDENGPMKPLHHLNPTRMEYLRDAICQHYGRATGLKPLKGLKIADIGCGGGLVAEPLCRMGADVTGVDAGQENINIAKAHAKAAGLDIDYRGTTAEDLSAKGATFDVVTALEIIEHVDDVDLFVETCCRLVKKDGLIIFSTLNRTPKSFALGIVAAEYILRWLPRGTHDWKKFLKPSEIAVRLASHGFKTQDVSGLVYNPLRNSYHLSRKDITVNYFLTAARD